MFIDGSRYLYQATRKRVYFKSITILIPSNWTTKPEYSSPGRLTFDVADIIVAPPNPLYAPNPYTLQVQGCGKPGRYIHFVEEFLTNPRTEDIFGNSGRVLVHEWGHLRWGLFNEYPDSVGDQNDLTYFYQSMEDEKWKPVACAIGYDIRSVVKDDAPNASSYRNCEGNEYDGYEEGCLAVASGPGTSTGSIMYGHLVFDQVVDFCDNDTNHPYNLHNREAPNKHNRLCGSKSAWEVMREHEDFKDGSSPPSKLGDSDIRPSFALAQARGSDECRIVIVIDTSGSMGTNNRILKAISAATGFIDLVIEGTWVGIVTFTKSHTIVHPLVQVSSPDDRSSLRNSLGLSASGGTCIGCGLYAAIQVLQEHPSGILDGGDILLMTDGEDSSFDTHPVRQTLVTEGVRVNALAIGQGAYNKLDTVSDETGGKLFSYGDGDISAELIASVTQIADRCWKADSSKGRVRLSAEGFTLGAGGVKGGRVFIDPSVGSGTQFIVTYTQGSDVMPGVTLIITKPNGQDIATGSAGYNEDAQRKVINVLIDGRAQSGEWLYRIRNTYSGTQSVTFSFYSRPNQEEVHDEGIISVISYTSDSVLNQSEDIEVLITYAEVMKGTRPVINATVKATVERPGGDSVTYDLLDNGAGADVTANDGVYTRSFLNFSGNGYYGIGISAENDGNALVLGRSGGSPAAAFINITEDGRVISHASIGNYTVRLPGDRIFQTLVFEKVAPFTRSSSAGSTNVPSLPPGFTPGQDLFPPNRVQDLRVKMTSVNDTSVVLTWTAPGDDLDTGTAMSYDIRISHSSALLLADFPNATILEPWRILKGNTSRPKPFGSIEEYVIKVPDLPTVTTFSYAIALRATDDSGKISPVSNLGVATFRRVIPTAPPPTPPPTIGPCDGIVCRNGGTLDESLCSCSCSDEFPGEFCEYVKSQLRNGVQIDLQGDQMEWQDSTGPLCTSVTEQLNLFCTNSFDICCPERGKILSESIKIEFVTENDVRVADGYPIIEGKEGGDDQLYKCSFVVYALRPTAQDVCSDASGPLSRYRRDDHTKVRRRSVEPDYISQDLLLEAVLSGSEAITSYLVNTTSFAISIANITLPVVEDDIVTTVTYDEPKGTSRSTVIIVIICILVVVIVILLLGVAFYRKRYRKNASYHAARKADPEEP